MSPGSIRKSLIGLLLLVPIACASSRMSTRDIYAELLWGGGLVCTPVEVARREQRQDERFHDRLVKLRPWLEAQIGTTEMAQMRHDYEEEMAGVYFVGCPSDEEHSHRRTRNWMLLHELENRSRDMPRG